MNIVIDQKKIEEDNTKTIQSMQIKQSLRDGGHAGKPKKQGTFAVEDFDAVGSITVNGATSAAVELELESLEEKPWRKPGADITDYFNYGFTEDTWAAYCNRQRRLRVNESGAGLTGGTAMLSQGSHRSTGAIPILGGQGDKMAGPPPSRKELEPSGISVMTHEKRIYPGKVLSNMDFSVPPPGFDPSLPPPSGGSGGPPPDLSAPPPSGEFPPTDPFGEYSEADPYSGGYEPTASAQWSAPPPGFGGGEAGEAGYGGERWAGRRRDSREDRYRDPRDRDHDRDRGRDRREGGSRRRSRSRSRDRDRGDRDRRDRDRDSGRDREREDRDKKVKKEKRSRSRSRSRSRKKSKKEKKEKDREDEGSSSRGEKGEAKENRDKPDTPAKVKEEPKE